MTQCAKAEALIGITKCESRDITLYFNRDAANLIMQPAPCLLQNGHDSACTLESILNHVYSQINLLKIDVTTICLQITTAYYQHNVCDGSIASAHASQDRSKDTVQKTLSPVSVWYMAALERCAQTLWQ